MGKIEETVSRWEFGSAHLQLCERLRSGCADVEVGDDADDSIEQEGGVGS
ncbi:hypothetical protein [Saccharothrix australiensis]|uniref:Uncharacterized protein n=1 Tax=Saccharothrix australiensis TaxID=2072 RepID=A0A495VJ16_9PSEU|nr:hypothetical protein [Saccharothrix australiensis]RKT49274.1 hypothetical protein C8E97_6770 [Saccharothrix australiensis]